MSTEKTPPGPSKRRGFSLLEMLLVLSLAPIVFFAVFSNFTTGIRLWQRLQVEVPEEDAAIFLLKAQRDFQNMIRYESAPCEGSPEEAVFMAGIDAAPELGGARALGRVRYFYDGSARGIVREVRDVSDLHRERTGRTALVLRGVSSLEFSYLKFKPLDDEFVWEDSYQPDAPADLPVAVKLRYELERSRTRVEQTFFIPAGGTVQ